ncbi:MAG TPA: hypothetical protein VN939_18265 [Chthoniobacterales bacterium]|nr:hypothetical protein [Chthoniobacterales bacterium]
MDGDFRSSEVQKSTTHEMADRLVAISFGSVFAIRESYCNALHYILEKSLLLAKPFGR